ncbi:MULTISPECIES: flagellar hook-associated protein FlgK [Nitrincola]|uniref:Flagellar hook-associated protein 1 n=1 Tax=Nitrincola nitratireducens TaxID=1229521 RepID=W9UR22_9GAMM|nr:MULTISPECIES: flagellar hook-associated protein FlgK [Nitrincola]EXJ09534.1 Flagellar hook-associated protein 1 [Nitrincola nitratireducens]
MSSNLLNLGLQSIRANQSALSVIGQNIANVNTPGYNRQVTNQSTRDNQMGVQVTDIQRITDQFLTRQLWSDTSSASYAQTFTLLADEIDNRLASSTSSVSTALDNYFKAMQNVVDDPISLPNREVFLAEARGLTQRFSELSASLTRQSQTINDQLVVYSQEVSSIAANIADMNEKIRLANAANRPSNELKDQRDEMVVKLSEYLDVSVVEQGRDQYSIFIGNGLPLVVDNSANVLTATRGDPSADQYQLSLLIAGRPADLSNQISRGKLGGLTEYREKILEPAQQELGRIAILVAGSMNDQHKMGMDLDGRLGGNLFRDINDAALTQQRISPKRTNDSTLSAGSVVITDATKLKASDYTLVVGLDAVATVKRESDGRVFSLSDMTSVASPSDVTEGSYYIDANSETLVVALDGFRVSLNTTTPMRPGDTFLIQPVATGASDIRTELTSGRQLALASPIRVEAPQDNTGTGVASVEITDINATSFSVSKRLQPPVEVRFSNTDPLTFSVFDMSNPNSPQALDLGNGPMVGQTFTPGVVIELDGYNVRINNQPKAGDRFSFDYNTDGVSDNRNALLMSGLQQKGMINTQSFQDIYGSMVSKVGTETSVAQINFRSSRSVLESTMNARASVSGVNLDEEAAKLIQYQQAYQASAQLIRASQTLFDSLLSVV